jgi:hypothetical protein
VPNMPTQDWLTVFAERLSHEWLPTYCDDPKRRYSIAGYKVRSNKVTSQDAQDFLRALDNGVVADSGGGRYRMPQSKANEVIFWEGSRTKIPRPVTLWMEPVITIASIARLHLDYGWPKRCLGMQSTKWEFDLMAFLPQDLEAEHIAGEVKKSVRELDCLIANLLDLCEDGKVDANMLPRSHVNAYKKYKGLLRSRAPLFWAIGPGNISHLFEVSYPSEQLVSLRPVPIQRLAYQSGEPKRELSQ